MERKKTMFVYQILKFYKGTEVYKTHNVQDAISEISRIY